MKKQNEIKKKPKKLNWCFVCLLILAAALLIGVIISYVLNISLTALLYNFLKSILGEETNG